MSAVFCQSNLEDKQQANTDIVKRMLWIWSFLTLKRIAFRQQTDILNVRELRVFLPAFS